MEETSDVVSGEVDPVKLSCPPRSTVTASHRGLRGIVGAWPESAAIESESSHDIGDIGCRFRPVSREDAAAMAAGHRGREQDRLVAGVAGAFEAVDLVHLDVLGSGPGGAAVTAQSAIVDREVRNPTGIMQLSHPLDDSVHRPSHRPTLGVAPVIVTAQMDPGHEASSLAGMEAFDLKLASSAAPSRGRGK